MKKRKGHEPWTLAEVEKYYGKESVDWIREKIVDGTIKPAESCGRGYFVICLRNPKCKRSFVTFKDKFRIGWQGGYPEIMLPDHLRYGDTVKVVVDMEVIEIRRWVLE